MIKADGDTTVNEYTSMVEGWRKRRRGVALAEPSLRPVELDFRHLLYRADCLNACGPPGSKMGLTDSVRLRDTAAVRTERPIRKRRSPRPGNPLPGRVASALENRMCLLYA